MLHLQILNSSCNLQSTQFFHSLLGLQYWWHYSIPSYLDLGRNYFCITYCPSFLGICDCVTAMDDVVVDAHEVEGWVCDDEKVEDMRKEEGERRKEDRRGIRAGGERKWKIWGEEGLGWPHGLGFVWRVAQKTHCSLYTLIKKSFALTWVILLLCIFDLTWVILLLSNDKTFTSNSTWIIMCDLHAIEYNYTEFCYMYVDIYFTMSTFYNFYSW